MAARGHCQLSKARVVNDKEVVHLWDEWGRINNKKVAGAAAREGKKK